MQSTNDIQRVGILTGGGDCPGLNAVIRAATRTAINRYGWEVVGIRDGFAGLVENETMPLELSDVKDIIWKGGTILGTTNRGEPHRYPVEENGEIIERDMRPQVLDNIAKLGLDALITIGGDGTQKIAWDFHERDIPVVGVPKTIDNDLNATDVTFGFDTAVRTATEAIMKLHSTAESHDRVMIVELMGRHTGWISLYSGIAGDADIILIPEIPFSLDHVCDHLRRQRDHQDNYSIIVVAEGAAPEGGDVAVLADERGSGGQVRLGGIGHQLEDAIQRQTGFDTRCVVVGHLQRGGRPTESDRILATRYGEAAVQFLAEGKFGTMVALRGTGIEPVSIADAIGSLKTVFPNGTLVKLARSMGISFGDGLTAKT